VKLDAPHSVKKDMDQLQDPQYLSIINRTIMLQNITMMSILLTYGCEAWTSTNRDKKYLRIFERRILRKIFGPLQNEDGSWRIRTNYELNELIRNADIVRFIKSRRIAWLGHVMRMDDKRTRKRILKWKPIGTRTRGRPWKRWIAESHLRENKLS
jgi:hypothetical protein